MQALSLTLDQLTEICDDAFGGVRLEEDGRIYVQRDPGAPWAFCGRLRNDQDSLLAQAIVEDCNEMLHS